MSEPDGWAVPAPAPAAPAGHRRDALGWPDDAVDLDPPPGTPSGSAPVAPGSSAAGGPVAGIGGGRRLARRRGLGAIVTAAAAAALAAGVVGGVAGSWLMDQSRGRAINDPTVTLPIAAPGSTTRSTGSIAGVAGAVLPSVVAIRVKNATEEGTGSGLIIDSGYILTNNHVVAPVATGGALRVVFQDGSQVDGTIVGRDDSYDLAVVKADVGGRKALVLGDSAGVVVGDPVIAIGAPLGLQGTVTTGIISALNRPVSAGDGGVASYINALQTDAAINPGNSGGPLVDLQGRVIGINSAIARAPGSASGQSGNIGLGFAIPSNQARRTAEQLIRTGKAEHPVIGVSLDRAYDGEGVRVAEVTGGAAPPVTPGGPADKAGIRAGDVITAVNGRPVTAADELIVAIRSQAIGDTVTLTVRRGGQQLSVPVTLAASGQ